MPPTVVEGVCDGDAQALRSVSNFKAAYSSSLRTHTQVFVASDDDAALEALRSVPALNVLFLPQDRSMLDSQWYVEDRIRHGLLVCA